MFEHQAFTHCRQFVVVGAGVWHWPVMEASILRKRWLGCNQMLHCHRLKPFFVHCFHVLLCARVSGVGEDTRLSRMESTPIFNYFNLSFWPIRIFPILPIVTPERSACYVQCASRSTDAAKRFVESFNCHSVGAGEIMRCANNALVVNRLPAPFVRCNRPFLDSVCVR